jgi:hypothetical protein
MTTLILRLVDAPRRDFERVLEVLDLIVESFADSHAMAREAQRRYPFIIE